MDCSFPKAGEPGKGKDEGRSLDKPRQQVGTQQVGAARQSVCVVCWRWCHLLHCVNVALWAPDHTKSRRFEAKLTWAKQVNPAFCLGYTQGKELTGMDKQPWIALMMKGTKHASKKLHSMRSLPSWGQWWE